MAYTITDEQKKELCTVITDEGMKHTNKPQIATYMTTPLLKGIENEKEPALIADECFEAVRGLDPNSMYPGYHNLTNGAVYICGLIRTELEKYWTA